MPELQAEGSLYDSTPRSEGLLAVSDKTEVVYPVVLVNVDRIKRALLDTRAGSSYASAQLINALHKRPAETQSKSR